MWGNYDCIRLCTASSLGNDWHIRNTFQFSRFEVLRLNWTSRRQKTKVKFHVLFSLVQRHFPHALCVSVCVCCSNHRLILNAQLVVCRLLEWRERVNIIHCCSRPQCRWYIVFILAHHRWSSIGECGDERSGTCVARYGRVYTTWQIVIYWRGARGGSVVWVLENEQMNAQGGGE